ncbi:MAG TPA: ATP-binding protein [Parapedobacter sp.]|uniref:sensor histidine kinase n=1 Tax=Parapedobacter sp. TaxID=1958893 RepID=UPI002CEB9405|nr:ATP-binding protein [Parapedobacter sp.]HWK57299.1 ATP-binding protein [Parapedobacter sp.]
MDILNYVQVSKQTLTGVIILGTLLCVMFWVMLVLFTVMYNRVRSLTADQVRAGRLAESDRVTKRLSEALHDDVQNQLAFASKLLADYIHANNRNEPTPSNLLTTARNLVLESIEELQNVGLLLDGKRVIEAGLLHAIKQFVSHLEKKRGLKIDVRADDISTDQLPDETVLELYRITQEALGNAVKHAKASRITVGFKESAPYALEIIICDNGVGFNPSVPQKSTSRGLEILRSRVTAIGAELTIDSAPGNGTLIRVSLAYPVKTCGKSP